MKFAVIHTGGKQYKVAEGDSLRIEKLSGDHKVGEALTFDKVLMISEDDKATLGMPYVAGKTVKATLEVIGRAQKVTVLKFKQKSRYFKKNGHRQPFFKVKINSIA